MATACCGATDEAIAEILEDKAGKGEEGKLPALASSAERGGSADTTSGAGGGPGGDPGGVTKPEVKELASEWVELSSGAAVPAPVWGETGGKATKSGRGIGGGLGGWPFVLACSAERVVP